MITGDDRFDDAILARGPAGSLSPLLDFDGRKAVFEAARELGIFVESGQVRLRTRGVEHDAATIVRTVRSMVAVARGLDPRDHDAVDQLVWMVRRDPVEGVRERAARALVQRHSDDARVDRLARELGDANLPARRLLSLELLGEAGIPVARGLAVDGNASPDVRARARDFLHDLGVELDLPDGGQLALADDPERAGALSNANPHEGALRLTKE